MTYYDKGEIGTIKLFQEFLTHADTNRGDVFQEIIHFMRRHCRGHEYKIKYIHKKEFYKEFHHVLLHKIGLIYTEK